MDYQCCDIGFRTKKLRSSLGINVGPHMLRHSCVVQLIEAGWCPHREGSRHSWHRRLDNASPTYGQGRPDDLSKHQEQAKR